jgi:hypothetical protein
MKITKLDILPYCKLATDQVEELQTEVDRLVYEINTSTQPQYYRNLLQGIWYATMIIGITIEWEESPENVHT